MKRGSRGSGVRAAGSTPVLSTKLKVYGGMVDGHFRAIIATTSAQKVADTLTALSDYSSRAYVRAHWTVTGNETEIAAAMAQPGVLLVERVLWSKQFTPYEKKRKAR